MTATTHDISSIYDSNKVHLEAPAQWLKKGWNDFTLAPGISLAYGAMFTLIGIGLFFGLDAIGQPYLILPLSGAFVFFAPWLAMGLFEVSRQHENDQVATFASTMTVWKRNPRRMGVMAFALLIMMMLWMQVAVVLYALIMGDGAHSPSDGLMQIFYSTQGLTLLGVGGLVGLLFASVVFLLTAVSMPMLMDKDVDVFEAMKVSYHTVTHNGHVMWSWAFTIGLITWFSMAVFFIGLVVVMPVLAYASWHAYRDLT